jgi:multidrug efflux pump subunit AcrA (membrane-fusion protein)
MQKPLSDKCPAGKRNFAPVLFLLIVIGITSGIAAFAEAADEKKGLLDVVTDAKALPVLVKKVQTGEIVQQLQTSGDVLPYLGADIHPKIGGEVIAVNVSESSVVKQGDLLAEIDHRILDTQLEQAQAAVTVAVSAVDARQYCKNCPLNLRWFLPKHRLRQ